MAAVRFIQGRNYQTLNLSSEGLELIKTLCDDSTSSLELLKKCCRAGICPVIIKSKFSKLSL